MIKNPLARNLFPRLVSGVIFAAIIVQCASYSAQTVEPATPATITVNYDPGHPLNRVVPSRALGAGVDGHSEHETDAQLTPANVRAMLSAGLKPLTYRLRTELGGEAWHWNPDGRWSDATHRQGYWTSSDRARAPIHVSYGYRLPRRGNTIDQANDDGYSRIDDGLATTFWKSNPYLDQHFTGDSNELHPQWVMIDLDELQPINAIKILWAKPFATNYEIQFGEFVGEEDLSQRLPTEWHTFANGKVSDGRGGTTVLRVSAPQPVRYLRILLQQSSNTSFIASKDIRDRLGFAIREVYAGTIDERGVFHDRLDHGRARNKQTDIYVSSTDPWHRASDLDKETEQPGFDFIFRTGLTNGLPMLTPAPILYDTPENVAAEIRYLKTRGYPVERVELGEEPDGQFVTAEDFAALYLQFEKVIHQINPALKLGGPSLQDIEQTEVPGRIEFGKAGWMGRFLKYLRERNQLNKFAFFSFEWYPFPDDCEPQQLVEGTQMLTDALEELQAGGLSREIPWLISEYGYSAFGARAEVDLDGALMNADAVGRFLTMGGETAYLYGYEASQVITEQECSSGNNMLFFRDDRGKIIKPTATYWAARMLTQEWFEPGNGSHELYAAASDTRNGNHDEVVSSYALRRPDGKWSVLLINRDPSRQFAPKVIVRNSTAGSIRELGGTLELVQFSSKQYELRGTAKDPQPFRSDPPASSTIDASSPRILLPPHSLTIVRGALARD